MRTGSAPRRRHVDDRRPRLRAGRPRQHEERAARFVGIVAVERDVPQQRDDALAVPFDQSVQRLDPQVGVGRIRRRDEELGPRREQRRIGAQRSPAAARTRRRRRRAGGRRRRRRDARRRDAVSAGGAAARRRGIAGWAPAATRCDPRRIAGGGGAAPPAQASAATPRAACGARRRGRRRRRGRHEGPQHIVTVQALRDLDAERAREARSSGSRETGVRGARWSGCAALWSPVSCSLCASQNSASSRLRFLRIGGHGLELRDRARPTALRRSSPWRAPSASNPAPRRRAHATLAIAQPRPSLSSPHLHVCLSYPPIPPPRSTCILTTRSRFAISRCTRSSAARSCRVAHGGFEQHRFQIAHDPRDVGRRRPEGRPDRYSRVSVRSVPASSRSYCQSCARASVRIARGEAEHDQLRALEVFRAAFAQRAIRRGSADSPASTACGAVDAGGVFTATADASPARP